MNWVLNKRRPAKAGNYTLCRRRISLNRQRRGRTVGETEEEKKKKESSGHGKEQKGNKWKEVTKPIVSHRLNVGSFLFFLFLNKKMFHSSTSLDTNWWIFRYDGGTCLVKIDNAHKLLLLPLARVFFLSSFFSLFFFSYCHGNRGLETQKVVFSGRMIEKNVRRKWAFTLYGVGNV